jgi:2-keto-4-pentenoate hydratase/2-oxohepta-3-ene-1,7-dioic acid hydratase in catechol pathway
MKLLTFETDAGPAVGAIAADGESVVDLTAAGVAPGMNELIARGAEGLASARVAVAEAGSEVHPLSACRVLAPIVRPLRNIICVGKNYYEHANEFHNSGFDAAADKTAVPEFPIFFTKATTSVIAAGDPIPASSDPTRSVDYEGELAVIISLGGRGIPRNRAFDHVFGYANLNDVTARALQRRHNQWFLGKSLDGFCPFGPYIVTADSAGDVGVVFPP